MNNITSIETFYAANKDSLSPTQKILVLTKMNEIWSSMLQSQQQFKSAKSASARANQAKIDESQPKVKEIQGEIVKACLTSKSVLDKESLK
jgi:hypothetical protein